MDIENSDHPPVPRPPESNSGEQGGDRGPRPPRRGRRGEGSPSGERRSEGSPSGERRGGSGERSEPRGGDGRRDRGGRSSGGDRRGGRPGERSGGRGRSGEGERGPRGRDRGPDKDKPADKPAPTSGDVVLDDAGSDLLAPVSRSFALTIKLLPEGLREPITLGYLVARAQDTVADTPGVPAVTRLEHLRALLEMVKYGSDAEVLRPLQRDLVAKQKHDGERDLLKQLGGCLASLEKLPTGDRWELRRTLARIGRAQELDLQRFGDAVPDAPKALATAAELDEYTYLIAGCVGELWTRLCQTHLEAGWSKKSEAEMMTLGRRFGQGLQMVNILRDLPEDLANGRCYLSEELLTQHGLTTADLTANPAKVRPLINDLRRQAVEHLDAGWQYVLSLTSRKLRYAVALPVLIGLETLGLLAKTSPLETSERLKVSRSSVKTLLASAAIGAAFAPWLSAQHSRLRKRASQNT